jgi:predicted MFS family arabinose efflux permease
MSVDLLLLFFTLFTWGIGEGLFIYFQPIYLQQLGADTMTIAAILGGFGLAMMVAHIPAGYLADRFGRRPLIIAAWICGLVATWIMAIARTLPLFVVGVLFYGLTAFVSSPLNSYVTAGRGKFSPTRAMTIMSASYNFGAVIGPFMGGWIGERLGLRTVYLVAACFFIISTAILLFIHPQPRDLHDPQSPPGKLRTNKGFLILSVIIFLGSFVMYLAQPLTPRFLQNEHGLTLETIGLLGSVGSLGNAALNLLLGHFAARTGFLLAHGTTFIFSLLIWKGAGVPWYALGYFMLGGYRATRAFIYAQARQLVHPAQMGLTYGIVETFNSLAMTLAPLLAGVLYTRSPGMVYPVSMVLIVISFVISLLFSPRRSPDRFAAS